MFSIELLETHDTHQCVLPERANRGDLGMRIDWVHRVLIELADDGKVEDPYDMTYGFPHRNAGTD